MKKPAFTTIWQYYTILKDVHLWIQMMRIKGNKQLLNLDKELGQLHKHALQY